MLLIDFLLVKEKTGKGEGKEKAVVKAKSIELIDQGRQESL